MHWSFQCVPSSTFTSGIYEPLLSFCLMCTPSAPPLLSCVSCILFTKDLVQRTLAHPKYAANYSFEKDASWITASPCGDGCADLPQVVALDCEMCLSEVRNPAVRQRVEVHRRERKSAAITDGMEKKEKKKRVLR